MAEPEKGPAPRQSKAEFDSLNSDYIEVTEDMGTVDTTFVPCGTVCADS